MKKLLLLFAILFIFFLPIGFQILKVDNINIGGGEKIEKSWEKNKDLKLKTSKERVLSYKILKEYKLEKKALSLGGAEEEASSTATSTATTTEEYEQVEITGASSTVEYVYISDEVATETPYFDRGLFASAEILHSDGNNETIAFYGEDKFYQDKKDVVYIKKATTTLEAFTGQIATKDLYDTILGLFVNTSIATTSYTTVETTTYNPGADGTLQLLIIGGGGSGGKGRGGGGGGGGFVATSGIAVTAQNYSVTVGGGGTAITVNDVVGINGATSSFDTIFAYGGGGGGAYENKPGLSGGSGGGAGGGNGAANTGGSGLQGYRGGNTNASYHSGGAGGGGAGQGGTDLPNQPPYVYGNGGNGATSTITGSAVVYAGGGGGGGDGSSNTPGTGGAGGGGAGSVTAAAATSGTNNKGGGGGGSVAGSNSGAGGSGIVILQFTAGGGGGSSPIYSSIINFE
jgi:hypothetical protein